MSASLSLCQSSRLLLGLLIKKEKEKKQSPVTDSIPLSSLSETK